MDGTRMCFCAVSRRQLPLEELVPIRVLRPGLMQILIAKHPFLEGDAFISLEELRKIDEQALLQKVQEAGRQAGPLERSVIAGMIGSELASLGCQADIRDPDSMFDRLTRFLAGWVFNWVFLLFATLAVVVWLMINAHLLISRPPDPPPFHLLNLILSGIACLFAMGAFFLQYQVQARRKRLEETQYQVNLRLELEIKILQEKLDQVTRTLGSGASPGPRRGP